MDAKRRFKYMLRKIQHNDRRSNETDASNDRGRLIDGGINFVVGSLRTIPGRNRGHANYRAQQGQNESPSSQLQQPTSVGVTIAHNATLSKDKDDDYDRR